MKLSQLTQADFVKLLLVGPSGSGKTVLASDFPGPIEYFDFDMKVSSAAKYYENDKQRLENINVHQFGQLPLKDRMNAFMAKAKEIDQLAHAKKELPFKTIVVDSLTTFVAAILEDYKSVSQLGIKRPMADVNSMQDYQLLGIHLLKIITGFLALPCNVVIVAHTQYEKDDVTGMIRNQILMPGQLSAKLPIYFEEVYLLKTDLNGKRVLQTQSDAKNDLRSQRKLPSEIPARYEEIIKKRNIEAKEAKQ